MDCKLKIGILTETSEGANEIINELYRNNIDHNKRKGDLCCIIDGARYEYAFRNHSYDQLILKDEYFINQDPKLVNRLLSESCVPAQYQIINLKQQDAIEYADKCRDDFKNYCNSRN